uniref:Ground-like domain-containing protein n=1 Tax=Acrobeloides nanus TaxID=290746 RepID=A0A914DSP2_9BILA
CPVSNCPEQQQNCECNCPAPRECQPPPKAEYCGSYCPKVQSYGRTDGDPQIAYPAGSVGAQNQGYVSGVVEGGAPEYINPGGPRPPELLSVAPAPAGGAYTQGAGMTLQMSMTKSTGSGGSYSDKVITEDSNLPQIDNKFVVTTVATTTTTPAPTTIDTYDEIVPTSEDLALEIEELNNETNALPTVKYTLPPSVTDEVSLTEDEVPNSSDLNVISVGSLDNTVQSENSTNSTIKLFNPDPLLDYNDNDLAADFNLKLKSKRLAGVKNVINKNPKCSHKLLRKLMKENMVASPTISKQMIFSAGRQMFKRPIDVVCSKNRFSYTVFSSKLFCEVTKKPVTCFAFVQPETRE